MISDKQRYFTVDEANALVPLLDQELQHLAELYREAATLYHELSLQGLSPREEDASPEDPPSLRHQRIELRVLAETIQEGLEEIQSYGCIVRDVEKGLVDFLSRRRGRDVYLCWSRGEHAVTCWHELHAGFQGRHPIAIADEFEGTYLH